MVCSRSSQRSILGQKGLSGFVTYSFELIGVGVDDSGQHRWVASFDDVVQLNLAVTKVDLSLVDLSLEIGSLTVVQVTVLVVL